MTDYRNDNVDDAPGSESGPVRTPRGTRVTPEETTSDTWRAEPTFREAPQQELMDLGVWLAEHPEAVSKNLERAHKDIVLPPGVYFNRGTGVVERLYSPQHAALGHQVYRVSRDPAAPIEEIQRKVKAGSSQGREAPGYDGPRGGLQGLRARLLANGRTGISSRSVTRPRPPTG